MSELAVGQRVQIKDGVLKGKQGYIAAPGTKRKPHKEDYPDPVFVRFDDIPTQFFPAGRLEVVRE